MSTTNTKPTLVNIDVPKITRWFEQVSDWLMDNIFVFSTLTQIGITIGIFFITYALSRKPIKKFDRYIHSRWDKQVLERHNEDAILSVIFPIFWACIQWLSAIIAEAAQQPHNVLIIIAKLLTAWVVIRFTSSLVRYPLWSKIIAVIAWVVTSLSIIGLLDPTIALLDGFAVEFGELRISALTVIKGIISLVVLLWLSGTLSGILEKRIQRLPHMTPSAKVLLSKFLKVTLITFALLIAINSLGIDLTALTVFGGAIGLGLGFGLQKVVSNLVSGVILLMDRSVKPGDVIELGTTYGWVNSLGARYVSVLTRDGYEHLIPNEDLITGKVINWSYSNTKIRLKIPVGVSYNADIHKVMELILEAANEHKRVLSLPEPVCRLIEFGDSSVNFELRLWINDPIEGVNNIRSDMLIAIWDKFKANNIEIPFPQRDVHLKASEELQELIQLLKNK